MHQNASEATYEEGKQYYWPASRAVVQLIPESAIALPSLPPPNVTATKIELERKPI